MEARWSVRQIAGIRQLEQRQFRVERGENPAIEPGTVIDSRLTPLGERFSSSGVDQIARSHMSYHWSYEAPLGALSFNVSGAYSSPAKDSCVAVREDLVIDVQKGFELSQQSRLTQSAGARNPEQPF